MSSTERLASTTRAGCTAAIGAGIGVALGLALGLAIAVTPCPSPDSFGCVDGNQRGRGAIVGVVAGVEGTIIGALVGALVGEHWTYVFGPAPAAGESAASTSPFAAAATYDVVPPHSVTGFGATLSFDPEGNPVMTPW